jgi:hypothetical protein
MSDSDMSTAGISVVTASPADADPLEDDPSGTDAPGGHLDHRREMSAPLESCFAERASSGGRKLRTTRSHPAVTSNPHRETRIPLHLHLPAGGAAYREISSCGTVEYRLAG